MTKIYFLFGLLFISFSAFASVGFLCPEISKEIERKSMGELHTLVIRDTQTLQEIFNSRLLLSSGLETASSENRKGVYEAMMDQSFMNFPYMSETQRAFHVSRASGLYQRGFLAFEKKGRPVKLSKMYCQAFIRTIDNY